MMRYFLLQYARQESKLPYLIKWIHSSLANLKAPSSSFFSCLVFILLGATRTFHPLAIVNVVEKMISIYLPECRIPPLGNQEFCKIWHTDDVKPMSPCGIISDILIILARIMLLLIGANACIPHIIHSVWGSNGAA
jgi:hypothetical protein